ncbi:MAG TPA: hypothetical protein VGP04_07950 [Pseudonocardiaceae bacterium]|nr:hypothetical protein [Pseudonocardiaceae bacterium]
MNRRTSEPPTEMSNGLPATPEFPRVGAARRSVDPGERHNPGQGTALTGHNSTAGPIPLLTRVECRAGSAVVP